MYAHLSPVSCCTQDRQFYSPGQLMPSWGRISLCWLHLPLSTGWLCAANMGADWTAATGGVVWWTNKRHSKRWGEPYALNILLGDSDTALGGQRIPPPHTHMHTHAADVWGVAAQVYCFIYIGNEYRLHPFSNVLLLSRGQPHPLPLISWSFLHELNWDPPSLSHLNYNVFWCNQIQFCILHKSMSCICEK